MGDFISKMLPIVVKMRQIFHMIQIKNRSIDEIKPANYNPRAIMDSSFEGLKESLRRFNVVDPLIVNTRTGNLVSGHQRLRAAQELGFKEVPVVEVDLSEADEMALNVTLNNPKIAGFFTDDLQALLDELKMDLGESVLVDLRLNELVIDNAWDSSSGVVDGIDENLDGISAIIKIKCPQEIKDEVLITVKKAILETSLEGVEVV